MIDFSETVTPAVHLAFVTPEGIHEKSCSIVGRISVDTEIGDRVPFAFFRMSVNEKEVGSLIVAQCIIDIIIADIGRTVGDTVFPLFFAQLRNFGNITDLIDLFEMPVIVLHGIR